MSDIKLILRKNNGKVLLSIDGDISGLDNGKYIFESNTLALEAKVTEMENLLVKKQRLIDVISMSGGYAKFKSEKLALESRVKELTEVANKALGALGNARFLIHKHFPEHSWNAGFNRDIQAVKQALSTTTPTPNFDKHDADVRDKAIEECATKLANIIKESPVINTETLVIGQCEHLIRQLKHSKE